MNNHTWILVYENQLDELFENYPNAVATKIERPKGFEDDPEYIVLVDENGNPVDKYLSLGML